MRIVAFLCVQSCTTLNVLLSVLEVSVNCGQFSQNSIWKVIQMKKNQKQDKRRVFLSIVEIHRFWQNIECCCLNSYPSFYKVISSQIGCQFSSNFTKTNFIFQDFTSLFLIILVASSMASLTPQILTDYAYRLYYSYRNVLKI